MRYRRADVTGGTYFHRELGGTKTNLAGGSCGRIAGGDAKGEVDSSVSYRCNGDSARSPARHLDLACG